MKLSEALGVIQQNLSGLDWVASTDLGTPSGDLKSWAESVMNGQVSLATPAVVPVIETDVPFSILKKANEITDLEASFAAVVVTDRGTEWMDYATDLTFWLQENRFGNPEEFGRPHTIQMMPLGENNTLAICIVFWKQTIRLKGADSPLALGFKL